MIQKVLIFLLPGLLYACVTVKPKVQFPCKVCLPLYNTSCQGLDPSDIESCATAKEAKVTYRLGLHPTSERFFIPPESCTIDLKCPGGSQLYNGYDKLGRNPVAWCQETGPNAGKWYTAPTPFLPIQLGPWVDRCRHPNWKPDFMKEWPSGDTVENEGDE